MSTDPVDYYYKGANYTTNYYDNSTGTWKSTGGNSVVVVSAHAHTIPTDQEVREWVRVFSRTETMANLYPGYNTWLITKVTAGMKGDAGTWIFASDPEAQTGSPIPDWTYDLLGSIPRYGSIASAVKVIVNWLSGGITVNKPSTSQWSVTLTNYSGVGSSVNLPNTITYSEADGNTSNQRYGFGVKFLLSQSGATKTYLTTSGQVYYKGQKLVNGYYYWVYPYTAEAKQTHTVFDY